MLYWDRLAPHSPAYNVPFALQIRGPLKLAALQKTIRLILSRQEVLRSHFLFTDDDPVQIVGPVPVEDACVSVIDLSDKSHRHDASSIKQIVDAEARRPYNLAKDLMLRAILFRFSEADHILLLNMHHIAADGWSVGVLAHELVEGYLAFAAGKEPALPPLSTQYSGFAKWQRELLQGSERERLFSFWREQLRGFPEFSESLPLDHPRPQQQSFQGSLVRTTLPESVLAALTEVGQMRRATLFMVMLAVLQLLLLRCSEKDEIAVGVPVANRNRTEFLDLIGCFMNMVVIRGNISGNPSFLDFLSRLRETSLAAFFHPELPFSELVRHLHPKRSPRYTPLFQVQFAFQNYPMPAINWPGLEVSRYELDTATSKFDLSVLAEPQNGLQLGFEYNTQLFNAQTMERLLQQYVSLLRSVVRSPEARVRDFPVETAASA